MQSLMKSCQSRYDDMVAFMEEMVNVDSPSGFAEGLTQAGEVIGRWFRKLSADITVHPSDSFGPTLEISAGIGHRQVLFVGHMDTVWPVGETAHRPFSISGGRAVGPGVQDMKSGIAIAWGAMAAAIELGLLAGRKIVLVVNPDEEIGSPSSRALIGRIGAASAAALILEPAGPDGALKTRRRGVFKYRIRTQGRSAHGSDPDAGVNAIMELAQQLVRISAFEPDPQLSINVGTITGGERVNVVPAEAVAELDVRADTVAAADRLHRRFEALTPALTGASVDIEVVQGHPPFERTPQNKDLFARVMRIAADEGVELRECAVGGASDGNLLSAAGVPTLDGLGAVGAGAHALSEFIELDCLVPRAALLGLIATRI